MTKPFSRVLIANRGEIAVRIANTLRKLGIESVVVYHPADRLSPAVALADRAVEITGTTPVAAYLDGEQIIAAARESGAEAIHPGYGFLSENAGFARAVAAAGLTFVGPTPEAIELMGDKVRARAFVEKHGFPVAPSAIEDDDPATFVERARRVGAPLLIKPSAGGGGKGMRIVRDLSVLDEEIERARSEGQRYFGDGRLYVERYVENPRHIEVQVLGDGHGNVVHLFERECSVQRRFQKIVEETPSPALTAQLREVICETAAGIARAAGYRNAGTVEFIYGNGEFFFLEMNTRLQVEHPVTEMVTGVDLVAEQLKVAAGHALPFIQEQIATRGHAIEYRIYAESPARGFTPTTGKVLRLGLPEGEGIRVDSGIREGQPVTSAFDPMLAKLIVHGPNRAEAIARADAALRDFALLGCETNVEFLRRLNSDPAFKAGDVHTGFLDANPALAEPAALPDETLRRLLAAAALSMRPVRDAADAIPELQAAMGAWRN
ncbi:acetyl-CoA carboxylase biotin carboxylase subunit [Rhodoligotrophos defluvii]|uniref:acetyl-CoA carboxylase biotin carboxylase subunit n=1 Tax=Rhodoligotrophos defluvii TaxID=2561934 RepID=UPI0010C99383|nr:biotin carboxylase N-terminal domain-containing protein [Rhodoligotrophos defluvii]